MDLLAFIALFFMFSVYSMPMIGFSYKICEVVYKRSLFTKSAMQIQAFSAGLLFLLCLGLGADYFMQGVYFSAGVQIMPQFRFTLFSHDFAYNPVLYMAIASAVLCLFCLLSAKFPKVTFFHFVGAVLGIGLVAGLAYWVFCICVYAPMDLSLDPATRIKPSAFTAYCIDFVSQVLGISGDIFTENPHALLTDMTVYRYAICLFVFLSAILFALYLVVLCTFFFRNSMDYGRDYYSFVLNKYGRAIFSFSFFQFLVVALLFGGFQISFLNNITEFVKMYLPNHVLYGQIALALLPILYFFLSLMMKRSFASASIPMQKKSLTMTTFVLDFFFGALVYFMIVDACGISRTILG